METTVAHWDYIGIMENGSTIVYYHSIVSNVTIVTLPLITTTELLLLLFTHFRIPRTVEGLLVEGPGFTHQGAEGLT